MRWILVLLLGIGYLTMTSPVLSGGSAVSNSEHFQSLSDTGFLIWKETEAPQKHFLSFLFDIWAETELEDSEEKLAVFALMLLLASILYSFLSPKVLIQKYFPKHYSTGFRQNVPVFLLYRNLRN